MELSLNDTMPDDGTAGTLLGRVWRPGSPDGPSPVAIRAEGVIDLSRHAPTSAALCAREDAVAVVRDGEGENLGPVEAILDNSRADRRDPSRPWFLAPCDLQAVKACGVTFVRSMLERVIEEQAKGDPDLAVDIRGAIADEVGQSISNIVPGSDEAARVKAVLVERGLWSQYLEVGIGPDAEVFTKCQPMGAVGTGAEIGILEKSSWNNPEPEVVLVVTAEGQVVGATLGNDVNLRDVEGRSALLLGKAKDNRASAAVGPFIRLFDDGFSIDDVRKMEIRLTVDGADDGFRLDGASSLAEISRDPLDLAGQACGANNHYPDGLVLYTGTMFAPTEDRDAPGQGFTHHLGDIVTIATPTLGALRNRIDYCHRLPRWSFGTGALMANLSARGLL